MTHIRKKYTDQGIATIKSYSEDGGSVGVVIEPTKGIVIFKMIEDEFPIESLKIPIFDKIATNQYEIEKAYYIKKFLNSKSLCEFIDDKYKILRFPLRFVFVYQSIDLNKITAEQRKNIYLTNRDIYFRNFFTIFGDNDLFSNFEKYDNKFIEIDTKFYGSIIERVVPENVTLIDIVPSEKKL